MAQFMRGKQSGLQNDLSAGLVSDLFALDTLARYGVNSQTSALAYDPVQSLLAVGTNESRFGSGQIYVFGQKRVCAIFTLPRRCSVQKLQFCADKLLSVDSKNDINIFSLESKKVQASYSPPGHVTALITDPALDYAFAGLQNGDVVAFDMDRQAAAPFKIPNLWREFQPRSRLVSVVSLALHPRDIGTLLIGYSDGAAIYSFKQNKATSFLFYELPAGAPGGSSDPATASKARCPKLTQALWHPTGTFILTGHDDESLVIWDAKMGKIVQARTLQATNVNVRGAASGSFGSKPGTLSLKAPLFRIAWCSKQNPEDTGILVAGGGPTNTMDRGITFIELGLTPVYATSSWQILSEHFERPKKQSVLQTPPNTDVVEFCVIPRASPHNAGCHDPIAIIAVLGSGELVTLSFPSGHPISATNQLHPSLSFVHPFINRIALTSVERTRWLGMTEKRSQGPPILKGGAGATLPTKRFEGRNIIQTAHADGTIRVWDAGDGDLVENEDMLQVDVARAVGRADDVDVVQMSMSGATGELAAGLRSGEVVIFRWDKNRNQGRDLPFSADEALGVHDIKDNADPDLREGLLPLTMFANSRAPVTALKMSDIGFCAAGFENGSVAVIDLRGPAVIFNASVLDLAKPARRSSIRRSNSQQVQSRKEWPTMVEFGIMKLEGEDYSSILLFVGTTTGRFVTFKILPQSNGAYSVQMVGSTSVDDEVVAICPLNVDDGQPASASQSAYAGLRNGLRLNGVVLVVTKAGARIFKPAAAKGASKAWHEYLCESAAIVRDEDRAALVTLCGDGNARTFSIPSLREIASIRVDRDLDMRRLPEAVIMSQGDIFGWTGPSEIAVLNSWGTGIDATNKLDKLLNPNVSIPPRPTISNIAWLSGTQHVTPIDMDILIGGPDRPPSKRMMEQMRSEDQQRRQAERTGGPSTATGAQDEGYWAYMQRQVQERTERLNIMGDSMDKLEESSSNWADGVNKFVSTQKKKAVMGIIGGKLGL